MSDVHAMRIQVADECGEEFREALAERLADTPIEVRPLDGSTMDAVVIGGWDVVDDLRLAVAGGARWIQTLTAGVDRVLDSGIDVEGRTLTNGSEATARPVSEFALARVLEHAKELRVLDEQQRRREWHTRWLGALADSTMTVVGLGSIGSRVARLARAFEMQVIGVRRTPDRGHPECDEVVGSSELGDVLERSDYCVLAPALTPETEGMISEAALDRAKEGLLIVNVGRGELIDHDALVRAVGRGRVTAALDVVPGEPLGRESPLWKTDGILVSPHTATLTPPLIRWLADLVAANTRRFAEGRPLENVVDRALGYPASRISSP